MTLTIENESYQINTMELSEEELTTCAREVIAASLDYEGCPYEVEVSLFLTDNEEIRRINREHRKIDRPTDVLSFPMLEYRTPADFTEAEERGWECFDPETGELVLGDIILSMEKVKEQAKKYGHSEKREFAFLITHSMLHLMGYDHETPEEAGQMEAKQTAILNSLNILR